MRSALRWLAALPLALAAACAPPGLEFPGRSNYLDAGHSGTDAGPDAGEDAGPDAGPSDGGDGGNDDGGVDDGGLGDGGPGDGGATDAGVDAGPVDAGCDTYARVIVPSCATSACHSTTSSIAGLDLESPDVFSRLIGVSSTEDPAGNLLLIDSNHPDKSMLYLKLLPSPPRPFGARMPQGVSPLSADDIACVQQWIHTAVGQ